MDENGGLNSNKIQKPKNEEKIINNNKFGEIKLDNFEDSLNLSEIVEDQCIGPKKEENHLITEDFSDDLDNIDEDEFTQRKISDYSIQSEEFKNEEININININKKFTNKISNEDISKKYTKKLTKEELDNIPLPVFACIYCSNMLISFKHLSQEIITNKYLFQTSIYDIKDINKLIIYQPLIDKDKKNEKLLDIIVKSTEYIYSNYNKENIFNFFKSKNYLDICNSEINNNKKYLTLKIEESIIKKKKDFYFKGIKIIPKNSINNRCLFNSTNSLINNYNALSGFVESIPLNNNNNLNYNLNMNKNNNTNNSNLSLNFNSISINNNEMGNLGKDNNNNNLLISIVEHIENNNEMPNEIEDKEEFIDLLELDEEKEKNFSKDNIIWDNNYYDIWNPVFSDIEKDNNDIEEEDNFGENYFKCGVNNDINNFNLYNKNMGNNNVFINKKRKFIKNTNKKIKSNGCDTNYESENKKNYKLKVNLLKSKTSNNSINFKLNQKLSVSQVKSFGSTNSSTMINFDNDYKIKGNNNFSNIKDKSNNSQILIYVNSIQENENFNKLINNNSILVNNKDITSKSQNFFHGLKETQMKPCRHFININNSCSVHPYVSHFNKKFQNFPASKNFFNITHFNFKIQNNYDISNIINACKYNKNKNKIFKEKKIKERNKIKIIGIKRIKDKSNLNFSKTVFNTYSSTNKPMSSFKNKNQISLNLNFNKAKVISNQLISSQKITRNKKINPLKYSSNTNIKNDKTKNRIINNNHKKMNLSQLSMHIKENEKISIEKIKQRIAELNKSIKIKRNINYNTNLNNKVKKVKLINGGLHTITNYKNKNIVSESKNYFGKRKLCLPNSFLMRTKSKANEKNNSKKFFLKTSQL